MASNKERMCPLFPDMPCPRGREAVNGCMVRMESDYDPIRDFKDYLFMNCAIKLANDEDKRKNSGRVNK